MEYPKILIINGQSVNKNNATGITLRSVVSSIPLDNMMEICLDDNNSENYNTLDIYSQSVSDIFPFQKVMRNSQLNITIRSGNKSQSKKSLKSMIKNRIRRLCINFADLSLMRMKFEYIDKILKFSPNVIYTLGGSVAVMKLALYISSYCDIPLVLHIMDDWPHYLQDDTGFGQNFYKKKLQKYYKKCLKRSIINLAISPYMADFFERETNISFYPLMNSVDVSNGRCNEKKFGSPIIFTYAGGLHLQRDSALMSLSYVLDDISLKQKIDIELHIYSNLALYHARTADFGKCTRFYDYVGHNKIKSIYEMSDILVHAEVSSAELLGYFRFSISTKISEYLISNRPVLFYGPKEIGLYEYLKSNEIAFTASDEKELVDVVCDLLNNSRKRQSVVKKAYDFVVKNCSKEKSEKTFIFVLQKAVHEWK